MAGVNTKLNKALVLDVISAFARFFMAYIWLKAGLAKLGEEMATTQSVAAYRIFTPEWSGYIAQLIAPLEIAGGVVLLLGLFLRQSSKLSNVVLVLFIIGIAQAWARGLQIDCGCFGIDPNDTEFVMDYLRTIIRDIFFIFLGFWTIKRPFTKWAIYP